MGTKDRPLGLMTTQESRDLLYKSLCAMLPYDVKCYIPLEDAIMTLTGKRLNYFCFHKDEWGLDYSHEYETVLNPLNSDLSIIKPYLRPMSSMTEEEDKIMRSYGFELISYDTGYTGFANIENCIDEVSFKFMEEFLNAHHLDHRGLLPKGLALEAPEGMYK